MATMFKVDGERIELLSLPAIPSLGQLQSLVGGNIEFVTFGDGSAFMVNEEGKLLGMQPNDSATILCAVKGWPGTLGGDYLAGDAVFFSAQEMQAMNVEEPDIETPEGRALVIKDLSLEIVSACVRLAHGKEPALPLAAVLAAVGISKRSYNITREDFDKFVNEAWEFVPSTEDVPVPAKKEG